MFLLNESFILAFMLASVVLFENFLKIKLGFDLQL